MTMQLQMSRSATPTPEAFGGQGRQLARASGFTTSRDRTLHADTRDGAASPAWAGNGAAPYRGTRAKRDMIKNNSGVQ
ncbi:hypothetical protein [Solimonas terrae]|uniref:Uncharacterized protein n=1 Tax=Solimonas terrae TaxID=1396819 RepID=A0A6M2BNS3_9GAMM|nr:hypothetical protein [Solimonas terrae]NGY03980.1 hypothetical protein [Solimonas terrae]